MAARQGAARALGLRARTRRSTTAALIREEYRGIRPAPGYPACPDHAVKAPLFELLRAHGARHDAHRELRDAADRGGVRLLLRRIPDAQYFAVGRIGEDQLDGLRARAPASRATIAERRLAPNLG